MGSMLPYIAYMDPMGMFSHDIRYPFSSGTAPAMFAGYDPFAGEKSGAIHMRWNLNDGGK